MEGEPDELGESLTCWFRDCADPDPPHAIVWKCPVGHRMTVRYCGAHIGQMMAVVMQAMADEPGSGLGCARCADPEAVLRPVLETAKRGAGGYRCRLADLGASQALNSHSTPPRTIPAAAQMPSSSPNLREHLSPFRPVRGGGDQGSDALTVPYPVSHRQCVTCITASRARVTFPVAGHSLSPGPTLRNRSTFGRKTCLVREVACRSGPFPPFRPESSPVSCGVRFACRTVPGYRALRPYPPEPRPAPRGTMLPGLPAPRGASHGACAGAEGQC